MEQNEDFKQVKLPGVNIKHVLLVVFNAPLFFYPLAMLLTSSFKEPTPELRLITTLVEALLWTYPLFLLIISWLLSNSYEKDPVKGKRNILIAIGLEFVFLIGFIIFLIV